MITAALGFARRGIHVFPVMVRGKEPACAGGFKAATTDSDIIRQWWHAEPNYNIGIATGSISGIFAVDIDSYEAETRLAKLEAEHEKLPNTVEVITARGRHLYFRYQLDHPVKNTAGRIAVGIDTRGDGGYTLAPPSLHPSGRVYAWSVDSGKSFATAPQWLLDRINGRANGKIEATPVTAWLSLLTDGVDEGQRNDACTRLCGYLLRRNVNAQMTLGLLQMWNVTRCRPPLDEAEVERITGSVAAAELRRRAGK
jgi:Bifunctional DNA primase/polymerase, N-terminal/Primase C terminal 1 (PriCT-1)